MSPSRVIEMLHRTIYHVTFSSEVSHQVLPECKYDFWLRIDDTVISSLCRPLHDIDLNCVPNGLIWRRLILKARDKGNGRHISFNQNTRDLITFRRELLTHIFMHRPKITKTSFYMKAKIKIKLKANDKTSRADLTTSAYLLFSVC